MFNIGSGELLVLLLLGLLVLGPERLPKAMGQVGRYVAQMRKLSSGFQDEIKRAMDPHDAPFRPGEERLARQRGRRGPGGRRRPPATRTTDDGDEPPLRMPEDADTVAGAPFAPAPPRARRAAAARVRRGDATGPEHDADARRRRTT